MKHENKTIFGLALAALIALSSSAQSVPPLINYQGQLTDSSGAALPAGIYSVQFKLWNDPLQAAPANFIWGQQQNISVLSNGVFNVILGTSGGSPIPGATPIATNLGSAFSGSNCFLGLTIVANPVTTLPNPSEIQPRQQLLSVPFALTAQSVLPGSITLTQLASRPVGVSVPVGGLAKSASSGNWVNTTTPNIMTHVVPLDVTLTTTGRPVQILLCGDNPPTDRSGLAGSTSLTYSEVWVQLVRDGSVVGNQRQYNSGGNYLEVVPGSFHFIDFPAPGNHTYQLFIQGGEGPADSTSASVSAVVLIAYEL